MYGSASQISTITNSKFSFNNGEGVKLNGPDISFLNNDISFNSGFGMIAYDPTQFIGVGNFFNNFEDNGFAEYAGMHNTFNLEFARNFYTETNFGVGADQYFLMNLNWDGLNGIVIEEDVFNGGQADLDNLYPYDNPSAWVGEAPVRQERLLLQNAMNDFSNQDYLSAEATLLLIIEDYPLSVEASSAVYYLFHIVSLTNQNYDDFINFLENLSVNTSTPLYKNIETIITKSYIKNEDYISAIERLEDIINNSEIVDEIILAMIDEGYCYMKIAENGYRNLPEKCTIKTRNIDEYQKKVRELESGFTFYPKVDNNPIVEKVILNNNYPNPFNPTTTISFSIPYDTNVFITVYNIKGQKIRKILEGNFEKGNHSVIWDGTDSNNKAVSSGIYFYKLETNNDALMKKMLLLK